MMVANKNFAKHLALFGLWVIFTVPNIIAIQTSHDKVELIRQLSRDAGLPQVKFNSSDVCLDEGCLETALYLISSMNASVNPCQNFYQFACGGWIEKNPVPPTGVVNGPGSALIEKVNNISMEILREPVDPVNDPIPLNMAKDCFHACLNLEQRERLGVEPLKQLINEFGEWPLLNPDLWNASGFDWFWAMSETGRRSLNPTLVQTTILPDHKDTDHYALILDQPNLALPREIFIAPENYAAILLAYENYIVEVAQALNSTMSEEELRAEAKLIIELETKLANISAPSEGRFNLSLTYNPFLLPDFQSLTDSVDAGVHINWKAYLDNIFSKSGVAIQPNERIIVYQVEYLKKLLPVLSDEISKGSPTLANYIVWRVVSSVAKEGNKALADISFRFSKALSGATEPPKTETACIDATNYFFGMALGGKYVERSNFDENFKDNLQEMVENIRSSFKEVVRSADWIKDETKEEALAKADAMRTFMAYPDWIHNKTAVENNFRGINASAVSRDSHFKNHVYGTEYSMGSLRSNLRDPVDKDMWIAYPGTVNAYNYFEFNAMIFPAGFLQPPYYGGHRPKHQNYAGAGMVMSHEITHAFDDRGSQYDRNGNAHNWWDPETKAEFVRKGQCMINQYGSYFVPAANMTLNGVKTLGENIGDNGGIRGSYRAYQKYVDVNGPELKLPGLEAFSVDQLFFLGFANIWCEATTPQYLVLQILRDVHSPSEYRVMGSLKNFSKFSEAFNCPVDANGMNPPQKDKCIVW